MLRRSSLIIAASLAVLSTYEPGAVCFASAAPAAQAVEDRFERPRFLKKEIKRYVFANTTMSQAQSTTEEHSTTPLPEVTLPPDQLAASQSAASLASAEAAWSAAHPGIPFGADLGLTTTSAAGSSPSSSQQQQQQQPPPQGQSDTQGAPQGSSATGSPPDIGNPPATTTSPPQQGGQTTAGPAVSIPIESDSGHGTSLGGVPVVSIPIQSDTGIGLSSVIAGGIPSLSIPIEGDSSHSAGVPETGGQPTGGQQTTQGGGIVAGPSVTPPANSVTGGAQPASTGAPQPDQTAEPATGSNGVVIAGSNPTNPAGHTGNPVPPLAFSNTESLIQALSSALEISSALPVVPQSIVNSLGQTVPNPAFTGTGAVAPVIIGSSTNAAGVVVPITASTPAQSTAGVPPPPVILGAATDAEGKVIPAPSGPVAANSAGQVVVGGSETLPAVTGSAGVPAVLGSVSLPAATNSAGQLVVGGSETLPAATGSAGVPVVVGSGSVPVATGTNGLPVVVGTESAPVATGSGAPVIIGSSTNSLGQVVPITASAPNQGTGAPVIIGSSTNSLGQVVPVTGAAPEASGTLPAGSTTNALGQVVPISSGAPALTNDRFAQPNALQASTAGPQLTGSQGAVETGPGPSVAPAASASVPAGQTPPLSAAGAPGTATNAPLPIATAPQSYNTNQNAPLTQLPTASDSMTEQPVGSSIEFASSSSPTGTSGPSETGLPSGVPLVLYPPTGPVNRPANAELIQIGFLYPLNYDFVWQHEESQRQIFHYLPIGIAYGLDIDLSNVTMQTLRAWDTTRDLHYITTLALAWIPAQLVDTLGLILHTQAEKFYHNPDPAVRTLLSMINPALPIRADNSTDGGSETGFGQSPTGTASANGGTIANGINNSSPVKASSVGIGVGVVCGAAAYGAAMFFVARRYKKRRQSHLRTPSMYSSPVMSHHGADPAAAAALMSGGMGERSISPYYDNDRGPSRGSGRSGSSAGRQQISAPVMAENSLGWN